MLLPTISDVSHMDYNLIQDYFVDFLKNKLQGRIIESHVSIGNNWCQDAGGYEVVPQGVRSRGDISLCILGRMKNGKSCTTIQV